MEPWETHLTVSYQKLYEEPRLFAYFEKSNQESMAIPSYS